MTRATPFVLFFASLLLVCCGDGEVAEVGPRRERPLVLTTFYPVTWMVERLAGDLVEVVCPLPEDADPIFWRPGDAELEAFMGADLVVANGAHFERWMASVTLPESRFVASAAGLEGELIEIPGEVTHSHGGKGAHSHAGIDGHTWVDPVNGQVQARAIAAALTRLLPDHRNEIERRLNDLVADLAGLDAELRSITAEAAARKQPILASHPAYNYLARRYGLAMTSFDLDPGEMPDEAATAKIRAALAEHPARAILWESAPLPAIAEALRRDLGLESFVFSPCEMMSAAERQGGADYLGVMKANLANLRSALALLPN